jgi:hypothetical protein
MTDDVDIRDEEGDLIDVAIYTRRARAASAYAAGLGTSIREEEAWFAAGILAGAGVDGITAVDVAALLARYSSLWMERGEMAVHAVPGGRVWTALAPAEGWEPDDSDGSSWAEGEEPPYIVIGAGFAETREAAVALAEHAWVLQPDFAGDSAAMPTVFLSAPQEHEAGLVAGMLARRHRLPLAAVDRAYGIVRAAGVEVTADTLVAAAAGITWGMQGPGADDA